MNLIKTGIVLLTGVTMFGCSDDKPSKYDTKNVAISGQRAVVELITELEDCKIYYVNLEQSPNLYMAKCGPGTTTTTRWSSGKNSSTTMITAEDQETLKKAEQIKKRQALLEKLSVEEKELLNLPSTPQIPTKK